MRTNLPPKPSIGNPKPTREERSILVAETVYQGRSSMPKTRASNRKVFVGDIVLEALSRVKSRGGKPDEFVFCTSKGTPFNPNNVRSRILIPACRKSGPPARRLARFPANLRYLVKSYRGEPEGAADATRTHQLPAHAGCLHPAHAGSATAAGRQSRRSFALSCSQIPYPGKWVGGRNPVKAKGKIWCARRDSNSRPVAPEATALSS